MPRPLKMLPAAAVAAALSPASAALAAGTGADMQVSGSASTGSPLVGTNLNYTFQGKASGPDTANGIVFTDVLPAGLTHLPPRGRGLPHPRPLPPRPRPPHPRPPRPGRPGQRHPPPQA